MSQDPGESPMLVTIPRKQTNRVDLGHVVLRLIRERCGANVAISPDVQKAAKTLGQLRNSAVLSVLMDKAHFGAPNENASRFMIEYINAVYLLGKLTDDKFLPGPGLDSPMFEWQDAFSTVPAKTSEYRLDLVACTINIGSSLAAIALQRSFEVKFGERELQAAARLYARAAGFFRYCRIDMPYMIAAGTADLYPPSHMACESALMANSQQLLYRSISGPGSMFPLGVRSRVAAGVREMYTIVVRNCDIAGMRNTQLSQRMVPVCSILVLYFNAEADLQASAECQQAAREGVNGKWGEAMGRMRRAAEGLLRANNSLGTLPTRLDETRYIREAVPNRLLLARQRLIAAVRDNDVMYHEAEEHPNALPDIEPERMVDVPDVSGDFAITELPPGLRPLLNI